MNTRQRERERERLLWKEVEADTHNKPKIYSKLIVLCAWFARAHACAMYSNVFTKAIADFGDALLSLHVLNFVDYPLCRMSFHHTRIGAHRLIIKRKLRK